MTDRALSQAPVYKTYRIVLEVLESADFVTRQTDRFCIQVLARSYTTR